MLQEVGNTVGKGEIARKNKYCRLVKTRACLKKGLNDNSKKKKIKKKGKKTDW